MTSFGAQPNGGGIERICASSNGENKGVVIIRAGLGLFPAGGEFTPRTNKIANAGPRQFANRPPCERLIRQFFSLALQIADADAADRSARRPHRAASDGLLRSANMATAG
jgi:hypothetical protein